MYIHFCTTYNIQYSTFFIVNTFYSRKSERAITAATNWNVENAIFNLPQDYLVKLVFLQQYLVHLPGGRSLHRSLDQHWPAFQIFVVGFSSNLRQRICKAILLGLEIKTFDYSNCYPKTRPTMLSQKKDKDCLVSCL